MVLKFSCMTVVLVFVATATSFPSIAIAQTISSTRQGGNETISETFNRAFFANDPDFFRNRSFKRQIDLIFGFGSFLDQEIARDTELVDILYRDVLNQQVSSDPVIRTRDLPNPYETSILTSPLSTVNSKTEESEFNTLPQP